ncbi:SDR family NAD(P)-dependent oxidoreductase [Haloarchaeobius sp. DFWS5]|uniref:SDR family NAD(P)-dependent oxidoreductase n=1 Tax=Haloarchaeobius sp. DFWS5 TaxID=3446114 RepID=UPI003EBEAC42
MLQGKNVLVTGGGGSVGRALIPRLLEDNLAVLRVFDNNEPSLSAIRAEHGDDRLRYLAGDVRDRERLDRAMSNIDVVVHTAAMKHVDICEYNPFEAVQTNVVGMQNVVDAAIDADVERVVFTSSDKAVDPANTMGTTKLLGEKLIIAGNKHAGEADLRLSSVRFGNVINSSQSVIPLFKEQISEGGPVTLTDPRMARFFLTFDDVADLVRTAIGKTQGGEIFVRKMPAIRIEDLAEAMIQELAPEFGYSPEDIDVEIVGRRLGETFHEEIVTERESYRTHESDRYYAVLPETADEPGHIDHDGLDGFEATDDIVRSSEPAQKLGKDEIVDFLYANDALGVDR